MREYTRKNWEEERIVDDGWFCQNIHCPDGRVKHHSTDPFFINQGFKVCTKCADHVFPFDSGKAGRPILPSSR